MTNWQMSSAGLYVPPGAADGAYVAIKDGTRFEQFGRLVDGSGTVVNVDPTTGNVSVDATGGGGGSTRSLAQPNGSLVRKYDFTSGTQSWTASAGTLAHDATNGRLQHTAGVATTTILLLEPSGAGNVADGELVADYSEETLSTTVLETGLFFRATDANNLYMLHMGLVGTGTTRIELWKRVAGTFTSLGASSVISQWRFPSPGVQTFRMMARFVGSHITAYVNETFAGAWNDTTFTTGYCGVRHLARNSTTQVAYFDDVCIYSLPSSWKYPAYD